ncbi:MAG: hypothetical protein JWM68_3016 [Verrucomicrobiales bacterium]|nr:hypothetical protein [Verrucomicrobiales bacterium]
MPNIVSKIIMWLTWLFVVLLAVLMAHYLTKGGPRINSFSRPFDLFATGMFLIPVLMCGGLRFWLSRIRNPWVALLPFFGGVFFAWQAGLYGIFLLPEFCMVFQILSAVLFLAYLPVFVQLRQTPPSFPTTKA